MTELHSPEAGGIFPDQGLDQPLCPCIGRQILNPWITKQVPMMTFFFFGWERKNTGIWCFMLSSTIFEHMIWFFLIFVLNIQPSLKVVWELKQGVSPQRTRSFRICVLTSQRALGWPQRTGLREDGDEMNALQYSWAYLVAQLVKNPPAMWETWVQSLGWEDPLENRTATHSSILALLWWLSW